VVGATFPGEIARVRELAPTLPLLIPGVGAQGGDAEATVRAGWRARRHPSSSTPRAPCCMPAPATTLPAAPRAAPRATNCSAHGFPLDPHPARALACAPAAACSGPVKRRPMTSETLIDEALARDGPESLLGVPTARGTDQRARACSPGVALPLRHAGRRSGRWRRCSGSQLPPALPDAQRLLLLLCFGLVTLLAAARAAGAAALGRGRAVRRRGADRLGHGADVGHARLGAGDGPGLAFYGLAGLPAVRGWRGGAWRFRWWRDGAGAAGCHLALAGCAAVGAARMPPAAACALHEPACCWWAAPGGRAAARRRGGAHMRAADEREHRFRSLLAIAADAYWEIDEKYRLVAGSSSATAAPPWRRRRPGPGALGSAAVRLRRRDAGRAAGRPRHPRALPQPAAAVAAAPAARVRHLVSGEPRFDERGVFCGYWGVVRDVTADLQRARRRWRPPKRATRSCSRASPRRWCCTAPAA
jgi:hypothetical protein